MDVFCSSCGWALFMAFVQSHCGISVSCGKCGHTSGIRLVPVEAEELPDSVSPANPTAQMVPPLTDFEVVALRGLLSPR